MTPRRRNIDCSQAKPAPTTIDSTEPSVIAWSSPGPTSSTTTGQTASFDVFYQSQRDNVAKTLALILGDDALGHEAADEAMSRAYERWATVSTFGNPEGWVYRTGLNWARSWLRRRKLGATKDALAAVEGRVVDQPDNTDVAAAISRLPHKYRAVVVLRYYRDWSVEQTAEALDIAPGTVKSRLSRALQKLEHELADRPAEGGPR